MGACIGRLPRAFSERGLEETSEAEDEQRRLPSRCRIGMGSAKASKADDSGGLGADDAEAPTAVVAGVGVVGGVSVGVVGASGGGRGGGSCNSGGSDAVRDSR